MSDQNVKFASIYVKFQVLILMQTSKEPSWKKELILFFIEKNNYMYVIPVLNLCNSFNSK